MTTTDVHEMRCTDRDDTVSVFTCTAEGCDRTVVLHAGGGRTVLRRGDEWATHQGGMSVVVGSSLP